MRKILFIVLTSLVLLFSCTREDFSISSATFRETEGGRIISLYIDSDSDDSYSFILTSPDGDLRWEGSLKEEREGVLSSDVIAITPSASFPKGGYSLIIHSSSGSDVNSEVKI